MKAQRLELAREARVRQREYLSSVDRLTTVEVPAISPDDLPSLSPLKDAFTFLEDVLFVSRTKEEDCRAIFDIYKRSEKFLLTRLLEFERDRPASTEQDKRLHLYHERLNYKDEKA